MKPQSVIEEIKFKHPRLIYLSGKTCTGKSTFANYLTQNDYEKIELDQIVLDSVVAPFNVPSGDGFRTAYRGLGPDEQVSTFINAAKGDILSKVARTSVVIEGAVATPRILKEIFAGNLSGFLFIYFHPVDVDAYEQRILSRFTAGAMTGNAGLPKDFWESIDLTDLEDFRKSALIPQGIRVSIHQYALKSMEESKTRLRDFQESFPEIIVIEF